ncbi:DoxX family protein [Gordonia sp. NPDC003950]
MANDTRPNEPGSSDGGPRDDATDSRPISVSELLARTQAADAGSASSTGRSRDGRGRRRAGRSGAVSVSELTGEIPKVTGPAAYDTPKSDTPKSDTAQPDTPQSGTGTAPAAASTPAPAAPAPASPAGPPTAPWSPSPESRSFPRASNPLARRGPDAVPAPDQASRTPAPTARTSSGMPGFAPPPTRDFSSRAVSGRLGSESTDTGSPSEGAPKPAAAENTANDEFEPSNAVTGIIPVVESADEDIVDEGHTGGGATESSEKAPASSRFSEVIDDDFEAYRSFADVEPEAEAPGGGKKRRWFSRRTKPAAAAAAGAGGVAAAAAAAKTGSAQQDSADTSVAASEPDALAKDQPDDVAADAVTGIIPIVDGPEIGEDVVMVDTDDVEGVDLAGPQDRFAEIIDSPEIDAADPAAPDIDDADTELPDTAPATSVDVTEDLDAAAIETGNGEPADTVAAGVSESDVPEPESDDLADDEDGDSGVSTAALAAGGLTGVAGAAAAGRALRSDDEADETDTAKSTGDATGKTGDATAKAEQPKKKKRDKRKPGKSESDGHSPALSWLAIVAEVVVGLVVGVGLFWGFTELWRWNPYFALILAVIVIFGIVTFTHLVRRTNDLVTTLLALAAGLIVTMGPLVLLAT